jgi:hypothetical protein
MNTLEFCQKYLNKHTKYTINHDGIIDVNGDIYLDCMLGDMEKLPVKFGKVGLFNIRSNDLTTLKGCPYYVKDFFSCRNNKLTSLECCPKYVGGNFYCDNLTHHVLGNVQGRINIENKHRIVI